MDYINKFTSYINSIFLPVVNENENENENKFSDIDRNNLQIMNELKNDKICDGKHEYGYSPYYASGPCRFCWGKIINKKLNI